MDRRDFLKGVAATPVVGKLSRGANALEEEQRFGDILFRARATDHYELLFTPTRARPLRILQLTDTHFHPGDETNRATEGTLRTIVESQKPDFVVHTGDFVNNDAKEAVDWVGLDIINGLGLPWALCFGNHDYPVHKADGSLPLDEIRLRMERGFQGYFDLANDRHYCYRHDILIMSESKPTLCLFYFQVGYATGDRKISDPQLAWFSRQLDVDRGHGINAPIAVFVHIPLIEYDDLFNSGTAEGKKGEDVCFDSDTGMSFAAFKDSGRVVGVFCGHDHVNNYHGMWDGIDLTYGRVSGWGGYGPADWKRGGRLINFDLSNPKPLPVHCEVF
jgi:3',5'-cyclic AMP phosphodiesterase CpdA